MKNEIERLEKRIGELITENQQLCKQLNKDKQRICFCCNEDYTHSKELVGQKVYICFECDSKFKEKLNGIGYIIFNDIKYGIVPISAIKI